MAWGLHFGGSASFGGSFLSILAFISSTVRGFGILNGVLLFQLATYISLGKFQRKFS
jgi:hypothetical protein